MQWRIAHNAATLRDDGHIVIHVKGRGNRRPAVGDHDQIVEDTQRRQNGHVDVTRTGQSDVRWESLTKVASDSEGSF